ncbi:S46 family peptidase [Aliidiomarina indica]|uniref:S46 family peptidase n=1 Tax=Aliidiomarina indica TaxID=2749147 RepID=UPI001890A578|nr:S46 family peptidase [Aliidiomarina indica]
MSGYQQQQLEPVNLASGRGLTLLIACLTLFLAAFTSAAKEGMWLPEQQPDWPMQPNTSTVLKVGACSGTFVSPKGLILTNHHCVVDLLQYRSTLEHNYLETGFLALSPELELRAPADFVVAKTLSRTEVTREVLQGVTDRITGRARFNMIANNRNEILRQCENAANIQCRVVEQYDGIGYLLIRDQIFPQVRLVWAPPEDVGHFGGVEDNWQWPRHSADLALLRVYGEDGKPFQPEHWLPLSPAAPSDGELVFTAGFPGLTQRYRVEKEARLALETFYPLAIDYLQAFEDIVHDHSVENNERVLRYAPALMRWGNRRQNFMGMLQAADEQNFFTKSAEQEANVRQWMRAQENADHYKHGIDLVHRALEARKETMAQQTWWSFFQELQLPLVAQRVYRLAQESARPNERRTRGFQAQQVPALRAQLRGQLRQFDPEVEQALLVQLLLRHQELPEQQQIRFIQRFFQLTNDSTKAQIEQRVAEIYAQSRLQKQDTLDEMMQLPLLELRRINDPWIRFAIDSADERLEWDTRERELRGIEQQGRSILMDGFRRWGRAQGIRLPDNANRTYRLSAGIVAAHPDADVDTDIIASRTTLSSLLTITGTEPRYTLPFAMHAAASVHGAGCLAISPQDLTLNFLSSADGTGGSSGSPTLNSRGELIGLVFDSTTDGILSDWMFDSRRHRLIHADVRYLLWLLRYVYQAQEVLDELQFTETDATCFVGDTPIIPTPIRVVDPHLDPAE